MAGSHSGTCRFSFSIGIQLIGLFHDYLFAIYDIYTLGGFL